MSGNPAGRPRLPDELRAIKSLTQMEACKLVSKYARLLPEELDAIVAAKKIPVLELAIARLFQVSIEKADERRLNFLLDRAVGKVPVIEPTDEEEAAIREIQALSDQELLRLVKAKLPMAETK